MHDIKKVKWDKINVEELFDITINKNVDGNKVDKNSGAKPYITRKESSNGLDGFIDFDESFLQKHTPVITIGNETATPFMHTYRFFTGTKVNVMKPKENLSKHSLLFVCQSLKQHKEKFSYSYTINSTRLKKQKILLPTKKNHKPDWEFIESYTESLIKKKKTKYIKYSETVTSKLMYKEISSLSSKTWAEFSIESIAEIMPGRDIYDKERESGKVPYVSSTSKNNGIAHYVSNTNDTLEKNCLSVNRNGSVGYSFFHPYLCLYSNDCRKLKLKSTSIYCGFFIANQISKQRKKYNYGYKMGTARLKRQKIMLPINSAGDPDYAYMEQYIINIEYKKRKKYIEYMRKSKT